jgi:hypothetical protein
VNKSEVATGCLDVVTAIEFGEMGQAARAGLNLERLEGAMGIGARSGAAAERGRRLLQIASS